MPAVQNYNVSVTLTTTSSVSTVDGPQGALANVLGVLNIPAGLKIANVNIERVT